MIRQTTAAQREKQLGEIQIKVGVGDVTGYKSAKQERTYPPQKKKNDLVKLISSPPPHQHNVDALADKYESPR